MSNVWTAEAVGARAARVILDTGRAIAALSPSHWTLACRSDAPFVVPNVIAVVGVNELSTPSVVEIRTDSELTFGKQYRLTYVNSGVSWTADFVAYAPVKVPGRAFALAQWIPEINWREDSTGELERFIACGDELLSVLLEDHDRWCDILDPDLAPERFVDGMLRDLGNPFTRATLSEVDKRRAVRILVPLCRLFGTDVGIMAAIRFFLGFSCEVEIWNGTGLRLGRSHLGVDWVLGGGSPWRWVLKVATPGGRAFTTEERGIALQILDVMTAAHEYVEVHEALPTPAGVTITSPAAGTVRLSWSAVAGATGYVVYLRTLPGAERLSGKRVAASGTSVDVSVPGGRPYYATVRALSASGEGCSSSEVSVAVS